MGDFDYQQLGNCESDYRPRRKGLGIRNAIKSKSAVTSESDAFGQWFFRTIIAAAPLTKFPPTNALIRAVAMMGGSHNTKGVSMPLFIDGDKPLFGPGNSDQGTSRAEEDRLPVSDRRSSSTHLELNKPVFSNVHPVTPPIDMIKQTVERASFRAIMNECLCRKVQGCVDYPLDLGCLFVGPAARVCVERGIAREASVEECLAHIDRAKEAGLSAAAYFVEVEEYIWGFRDEDMPNFLEFCFCCPCCCSAVRFEQRAGGELKRILHQGSGWSCVVEADRCTGCGACERACPHERIAVEGGCARARAECAGCGQCLKVCPQGALSVRQVGPTKPQIEDYFEKLHAIW